MTRYFIWKSILWYPWSKLPEH